MTKKQALQLFKKFIKIKIPKGDKPALCEAWNNYVDGLQKDKQITIKRTAGAIHFERKELSHDSFILFLTG